MNERKQNECAGEGANIAPPPLAVIIAGGLSRRMGEEKAFVELGGKSLLARTIERLAPQIGDIVINANGDPGRFDKFGLEVIGDAMPGHKGPLAGILSAIIHLRRNYPYASHVLTTPCDTPFFPTDLVLRLQETANMPENRNLPVIAATGVLRRRRGQDEADATVAQLQIQPIFALWPASMERKIERFLLKGEYRLNDLLERHGFRRVIFPLARTSDAPGMADEGPLSFFNINNRDDLETVRRRLSSTSMRGTTS
jgi:molybdopterin-guanine dinucleotide biosynthesis protein A